MRVPSHTDSAFDFGRRKVRNHWSKLWIAVIEVRAAVPVGFVFLGPFAFCGRVGVRGAVVLLCGESGSPVGGVTDLFGGLIGSAAGRLDGPIVDLTGVIDQDGQVVRGVVGRLVQRFRGCLGGRPRPERLCDLGRRVECSVPLGLDQKEMLQAGRKLGAAGAVAGPGESVLSVRDLARGATAASRAAMTCWISDRGAPRYDTRAALPRSQLFAPPLHLFAFCVLYFAHTPPLLKDKLPAGLGRGVVPNRGSQICRVSPKVQQGVLPLSAPCV